MRIRFNVYFFFIWLYGSHDLDNEFKKLTQIDPNRSNILSFRYIFFFKKILF
jgi:hypothetical protein